MSTFTVSVGVAASGDSAFREIEAVVDTGAAYTFLPASLLDGLGVPRARTRGFRLADGTRKEYDLGEARLRLEGRALHSPVVFAAEGVALLGATTLEIFDLIPDTTNGQLITPPEALAVGILPA